MRLVNEPVPLAKSSSTDPSRNTCRCTGDLVEPESDADAPLISSSRPPDLLLQEIVAKLSPDSDCKWRAKASAFGCSSRINSAAKSWMRKASNIFWRAVEPASGLILSVCTAKLLGLRERLSWLIHLLNSVTGRAAATWLLPSQRRSDQHRGGFR